MTKLGVFPMQSYSFRYHLARMEHAHWLKTDISNTPKRRQEDPDTEKDKKAETAKRTLCVGFKHSAAIAMRASKSPSSVGYVTVPCIIRALQAKKTENSVVHQHKRHYWTIVPKLALKNDQKVLFNRGISSARHNERRSRGFLRHVTLTLSLHQTPECPSTRSIHPSLPSFCFSSKDRNKHDFGRFFWKTIRRRDDSLKSREASYDLKRKEPTDSCTT